MFLFDCPKNDKTIINWNELRNNIFNIYIQN
jgi:hypothetical protein